MHKIDKNTFLNLEDTFRLHCFPDIPVGNAAENGQCVNHFQRIELGDHNKTGSDMFNDSNGNGCPAEEREEKLREIEKQAYVEGFTKGETDGFLSGEKKLEPVLNNFTKAFVELEKAKREIYLKAEKVTIELAVAIARKIVGYEVRTNKEFILSVVRQALKKIVDHQKITIKISPSDFQVLKDTKLKFQHLIDHTSNVTFEADGAITGGGCIIETNSGDIDARIEQQFKVVEEAFMAEFHESGKGG